MAPLIPDLSTKCRLLDGRNLPHVNEWPTLIGVAPSVAVGMVMDGRVEWHGTFTTTEAAHSEADRWVAELVAL